jgi:hypothetical protein
MESANLTISQAWKFTLAAVIIMCSEVFLPILVICCANCIEFIDDLKTTSKPSDTIVYEKA